MWDVPHRIAMTERGRTEIPTIRVRFEVGSRSAVAVLCAHMHRADGAAAAPHRPHRLAKPLRGDDPDDDLLESRTNRRCHDARGIQLREGLVAMVACLVPGVVPRPDGLEDGHDLAHLRR